MERNNAVTATSRIAERYRRVRINNNAHLHLRGVIGNMTHRSRMIIVRRRRGVWWHRAIIITIRCWAITLNMYTAHAQ